MVRNRYFKNSPSDVAVFSSLLESLNPNQRLAVNALMNKYVAVFSSLLESLNLAPIQAPEPKSSSGCCFLFPFGVIESVVFSVSFRLFVPSLSLS